MYQCAMALQTSVVPSRAARHDRAMRNESRAYDEERSARLAAVASRQWGCVTHRQLLESGYSKDEIHRMVGRGWLIRMHRGVYVLGALSPAPEQRWAAALLAGGTGAALTHTASAGNFGWIQPREIIEISAPRKRRGDQHLTIHRRSRIEVTQHNGLPTTTVAQTLLDLVAAGWSIDRFTQEAAATGQISLDALRAFAAQRCGARGAKRLAEAAGQPLIRSRMEARALRELGVPAINERVHGEEVDLSWDGLVVELDHDQTHGSKWARERDARKDQRLKKRGIEVHRFTA
jgi:Transcriptional regulator, AbiEi antitoxin